MKIAYSNTKSANLMEISRLGIESAGHEPVFITIKTCSKIKSCDFVVIFGYNLTANPLRKQMSKAAASANIPIVYMEARLFDGLKGKGWFAITVGIKGRGIEYCRYKANDSERWELIKDQIDLLPWVDHTDRNDIVILAHNPFGYRNYTVQARIQIKQINALSTRLKKDCPYRNILISWHPKSGKKPQYDILKKRDKIKYCIGWHTNYLCQAVIAGIPVVCLDNDCFAYDVASHDYSLPLITPDRQMWLNHAGWYNWSVTEIQQGLPWEVITSSPLMPYHQRKIEKGHTY